MTNPFVVDSQKLEADAYVFLYEIQLYPTGSLYICATQTVNWQGDTYQYWGMTLTGVGYSSDERTNRPLLQLANFTYDADQNPIRGVFSALAAQNKIEGATVTQKKVLKTHIDTNENIYEEKTWKVARISSHTPDVISLELRNSLDGPRFIVPARRFLPPEFPQVSLN